MEKGAGPRTEKGAGPRTDKGAGRRIQKGAGPRTGNGAWPHIERGALAGSSQQPLGPLADKATSEEWQKSYARQLRYSSGSEGGG